MKSFLSPIQFEEMIESGLILPGDMMNIQSGEPGIVGWAIERTQRKLLRDLDRTITRPEARELAKYTHTACVVDSTRIAELFRPKARTRYWSEVFAPGSTTVIQIRRPAYLISDDTEVWRGNRIRDMAMADVRIERPYPTRELFLHYGWRWNLQKLWIGRRFGKVFTSKEQDVCSGSYWRWCLEAGAINLEGLGASDRRPEAWYPARLAFDYRHFITIGRFAVIAGTVPEKQPDQRPWQPWVDAENPPVPGYSAGLSGPFQPVC